MNLATFNSFGKITISKRAIAKVASVSALECAGVVGLVPQRTFFKGNSSSVSHNGVVVSILENDCMNISVYVVMRHSGVSAQAVSDSIRQSVKYNVERFAGMVVREVFVHIVDVKL